MLLTTFKYSSILAIPRVANVVMGNAANFRALSKKSESRMGGENYLSLQYVDKTLYVVASLGGRH